MATPAEPGRVRPDADRGASPGDAVGRGGGAAQPGRGGSACRTAPATCRHTGGAGGLVRGPRPRGCRCRRPGLARPPPPSARATAVSLRGPGGAGLGRPSVCCRARADGGAAPGAPRRRPRRPRGRADAARRPPRSRGAVSAPAVACPKPSARALISRLVELGLSRTRRGEARVGGRPRRGRGSRSRRHPGAAVPAVIDAAWAEMGRADPFGRAGHLRVRWRRSGGARRTPAARCRRRSPRRRPGSSRRTWCWAMFGGTTELVVARRRSLGAEAANRPGQPASTRPARTRWTSSRRPEAEVSVEVRGPRHGGRSRPARLGGRSRPQPAHRRRRRGGLVRLTSPMVGAFYRRPAPDQPECRGASASRPATRSA